MRTYGLIGYPLGHSFSSRFFTEKFAREQKQEKYLNFEISTIDRVIDVILSHCELVGLNVTIPYKSQIIPFLDELDDTSRAIGAVNTIRIERRSHGRIYLKGFNTDVYGFEESIRPILKPWHKKALVLGSGGASKAVLYVFEKMGIGTSLVSRKQNQEKTLTYSELTREIMSENTIIINTTPLGTYPETGLFPEIPYGYLTEKHLLYDLVYNPPITEFIKRGLDKKVTIKNGYEMLELQALKAYEIWNH